MGNVNGFIQIKRSKQHSRPVQLRVQDWKDVYLPTPEKDVRDQGSRCMDCGIPFCHQGCPLGNQIPDWNDLVYRHRWQAASERLHSTNNFPDFTGRLCPAPCEGSCVLGINNDPVTIKNIELSIVERAFEEGWIRATPPATRTGKSRRRHRIGACRSRRRGSAEQGRAPRHGVREIRPHRRPAALRHPGIQDREAVPHPAAGPARAGRRAVPHRRERRRRRPGRDPARRVRRPRPLRRRRLGARSAGSRP